MLVETEKKLQCIANVSVYFLNIIGRKYHQPFSFHEILFQTSNYRELSQTSPSAPAG